jgi:myo-inositol 2-dehydrogenase/D-chiro-inositol 1-dehydrogenase
LAGAVLTRELLAPTVYAAGSDTLKIGLIGCGGRGTGAAKEALAGDSGTLLTAMGDVFSDRLQGSFKALSEARPEQVKVGADHQFIGFDAYQKVIDSGVDVVLLTTPPHFRPAHLKAAIAAGKHVFCEKPMAVDAPGVRSILASAEEAKRRDLCLVAGFCWRYSDAERATFQKIVDGALGRIVSAHTTYHASPLAQFPRQPGWSDMEWQLRNWFHFTWLSGDHIAEQACHSIDKIAWALGGRLPVKATALGGRQARTGAESGNVYDHFSVVYEYDDGLRCFHTCRQMADCPFDNTDYFVGTEAVCHIDGWKPLHEIKTHAGETRWSYDGQRRNMYQNEHDALFAAIRSGQPINDGQWMAHSTLMAIMGRMAAYTGQTLTWEQALNSQEDLTPAKYEFGDLPVTPVAIPGRTKFL